MSQLANGIGLRRVAVSGRVAIPAHVSAKDSLRGSSVHAALAGTRPQGVSQLAVELLVEDVQDTIESLEVDLLRIG